VRYVCNSNEYFNIITATGGLNPINITLVMAKQNKILKINGPFHELGHHNIWQ